MPDIFRSVSTSAAVIVIFFAMYRVLSLGLSDYYVTAFFSGDGTALGKALSWEDHNPKALYLQAKESLRSNKAVAAAEIKKSISGNPADARAVLLAASGTDVFPVQNDRDQLYSRAVSLMPADKTVRLQAASYWVSRNMLHRAVADWGVALSIDPALGQVLYPLFMQIVQSAQARTSLAGLVDAPPAWWEDFVRYLSANVENPDALLELMHMRRQSDAPISITERKYAVESLMQAGRWPAAYLLWVEGLAREDRRFLGMVYNGDFESQSKQYGFNWRLTKSKDIDVILQRDTSAAGENALYLRFYGKEIRFQHVSQYLLLAPGSYTFRSSARTGLLAGRGRLKWFVRCADDLRDSLGSSQNIVMSKEWSQQRFSFQVPDGDKCKAQLLRLETTGKHLFDHKLKGELWLDRVSITRQNLAG